LFSSSLGFVLTLAISAAWLYYAIAVVGLMRLRASQPDRERPYKMWGYPVTPLLFLLGTAGFLASLTYQSPKPALCVLLIMAASFPIHSFVGRSKSA
jgi:APA family basic amino acid/polyamine antiporter